MATANLPSVPLKNGYPTSDGRPMAETDWHRDLMLLLISVLKTYYAGQPRVYVSGNLLIFYEPGNKRRHISPDVFVVKGVADYQRPNYLVWEEGRGPNVVIELTSSSTRREDVEQKYRLYQDVLRVREYFLFDPLGDYLRPQLQGYRLRQGAYHPIRPVAGRLPSQVLGLHLEGNDRELRLYDAASQNWLPTPAEHVAMAASARLWAEAERQRADTERDRAELERQRAEAERQRAELERQRAEAHQQRADDANAEIERLRRELEELRRRPRP